MYLKGYAGTEVVIRDLAVGVQAQGYQPLIYSPILGKVADEIAANGIQVVNNLNDLSIQPDIIHGHHFIQTLEALAHFPNTPGIYVCHDRLHWNDTPPRLDRLKQYVAVDYNCRERLIDEAQVSPEAIQVIGNTVDLTRFQPRSPLPDKPRRALIFSNYAQRNTHVESIQTACATLNLPVDIVGEKHGTAHSNPEQILGDYDLVFAKARCALEAMAVGCAVILCDTQGLGSLVTATEVAQFRHWNFGMRLLQHPLNPEGIISQIKRYNAKDAAIVSRYIRDQASLQQGLNQYLTLYKKVITEWQAEPSSELDSDDHLKIALEKIKELGSQINELKVERNSYYSKIHKISQIVQD
ncbi:MAG: glycosyltransferase [Chloroflexota bacterium]